MKLYLIICNFEKFRVVNEVAFNSIRLLAKQYGFETQIAYISQLKYCTQGEMEIAQKDYPNVSFYMYDKNKSENECIFDCLSKSKADRYFVCDARYLEEEDVINQMLDYASNYGVHFVRCDCKYTGVFENVAKFFKSWHNKVLKVVSTAQFCSYVRNLVIFDDTVYSYMERSSINSARIRETDMLVNTIDAIVDAPEGFVKAKHFNNNWLGLTIGCVSMLLAIWCFVCIFIASTSFNQTSWLFVGFVLFGVVGYILFLTSLASSRTAFYKTLVKHTPTEPILSFPAAKKSLGKGKEANEQKIASAVAKNFEVAKQKPKTKEKSVNKQK